MNYSVKVLVWVLLSFLFVGCMGPDRSSELVVIDAGHGDTTLVHIVVVKKRKIWYYKLQKNSIKR